MTTTNQPDTPSLFKILGTRIDHSSPDMQPHHIALIVSLMPLFTIHACYFISVMADLVPACIPYIEGCTSISRAARQGNAIFLFRATMISNAVFLMVYWWLAYQCFRAQQWEHERLAKIMLVFGSFGAVFLIIYADFLGTKGDVYRFMRRYGIMVYFTFTPIAQLIQLYIQIRLDRRSSVKRSAVTIQKLLCAAMLVIAIISFVYDALDLNTFETECIVEWNFALLMTLYFFFTYRIWRSYGFRILIR